MIPFYFQRRLKVCFFIFLFYESLICMIENTSLRRNLFNLIPISNFPIFISVPGVCGPAREANRLVAALAPEIDVLISLPI
jgi:hypothetical protein